MKRPGSLESFIAGAALFGAVELETGCKGKEQTQAPKALEIIGMKSQVDISGSTTQVQSKEIARYHYTTTHRSDIGGALANCADNLPDSVLNKPRTDNNVEFCYEVQEPNTNGVRTGCTEITFSEREDGAHDAFFHYKPEGMTSVGNMSEWTETPPPITAEIKEGSVNVTAESLKACQMYTQAFGTKAHPKNLEETPTQGGGEAKVEGEAKAKSEGKTEKGVDGEASVDASAGASIGGDTKADAEVEKKVQLI